MLNNPNLGKYIVIGLVVLVLLVIGSVAWTIANPPKKAEDFNPSDLKAKSLKELSRDHITDIADQQYNSNPPTSGSHFPLWAKRGVYKTPLSDGYLIHSLEHGYVVISYNCGQKGSAEYQVLTTKQPLTKMEGDEKSASMRPLTPDNLPKEQMKLPADFASSECQSLVSELSQFLDVYQRVIVIPRPNIESRIALTAWGKIDKMDSFDKNRINAFIASFHNKGPEQTVE